MNFGEEVTCENTYVLAKRTIVGRSQVRYAVGGKDDLQQVFLPSLQVGLVLFEHLCIFLAEIMLPLRLRPLFMKIWTRLRVTFFFLLS